MRKITLILSLLCLVCFGVNAQTIEISDNPVITGLMEIPTERVDLSEGLETGYYLLKQVNDNNDCAGGGSPVVGWIKAKGEEAGQNATCKNTGTPTDATYIWYVEVIDKDNRLIKISTANKIASWCLPENTTHVKPLKPYDEATVMQYHHEKSVNVGNGGENSPKEGSAFISNNPVTSYVHFSGDDLGSWTSSGTNSTYMVEFYKIDNSKLLNSNERAITPSTGRFTKGGTDWKSVWSSNSEPSVELYVENDINNMTVVDNKIELWSGSNHEAIYTLKVAPGYVIKGYSFDFMGKNVSENRFVTVKAGETEVNSTAERQTFEITGISTRSTDFELIGYVEGDAQEKNNGIIVSNFKLNIGKAQVFDEKFAANNRIKISDAPRNGMWADNTTWYLIQIKQDNRYISTKNINNNGYLQTTSSARPKNNDAEALWCIVGDQENGYKFYNKASGTGKVLYGSRELNSGGESFSMQDDSNVENVYFDVVASKVTVSDNDTRQPYIAIKDHNSEHNYLNHRSPNLAYWDTASALEGRGSAFAFVSPDDIEVSMREAQSKVSNAIKYTKGEKVSLHVDSENNEAPGYLWCNNPESTEGSISQLIDGIVEHNNFFHTNWHGGGETPHYIEVDLGENNELTDFIIEYSTRINDNGTLADFPDAIEILGSDDKENYTSVTTLNDNMPQQEGKTWTSGLVCAGKAYRYIRFVVKAEKTFWHMSEFSIYNANIEEYEDLDMYKELHMQTYNLASVVNIETESVLNLALLKNTLDKKLYVLNATTTIKPGCFYRLHNVKYESEYAYAHMNYNNTHFKYLNYGNEFLWKCETDGENLYLKNVQTASYMNYAEAYKPIYLNEEEKGIITISELGGRQVNIKLANEAIHAQISDGAVVPWGGEKDSPSAWYIEEIASPVSHTVTVGPAGYATLMLGFDAKIPSIEGEENGVYTAVINGGWAVMTKVEDVLPANTAVIIKANPGDYEFVYTTETATITENDLKGTLYNKNIDEKAYVLGKDENDVAYLGVAKMTDGKFLNNANKAYLPAPAEASNVAYYGLRFDFDGTTGVEEVEIRNEKEEIYDLTGRRVNEITKAGVYIVNGKKVLVK